MAAKTLEARLDDELEMIEVGAKVMREGIDCQTPVERLKWIGDRVQEALTLAHKIERRDRRLARAEA